MPAMRCNEVVISIALVLRREAAETEQMSHRGHSPVALRERRTARLRHAMNRSDKNMKIENPFKVQKSRNHATAHRVVSSQWLGVFFKRFVKWHKYPSK